MKFLSVFLFPLLVSLSTFSVAESLYKESSYQPLAADRSLYRVGDTVTVMVFENSSASASADTKTEKSGGLGAIINLPSTDKSADIRLREDFEGKGRIQRSGKLLAQLSVTVQEVAKNGDLLIKGQQLLEINNDKQNILLEGRVRPQDISEFNTIPSSRIADAKISYVGEGILAQKSTPGLLSIIFTILGLL